MNSLWKSICNLSKSLRFRPVNSAVRDEKQSGFTFASFNQSHEIKNERRRGGKTGNIDDVRATSSGNVAPHNHMIGENSQPRATTNNRNHLNAKYFPLALKSNRDHRCERMALVNNKSKAAKFRSRGENQEKKTKNVCNINANRFHNGTSKQITKVSLTAEIIITKLKEKNCSSAKLFYSLPLFDATIDVTNSQISLRKHTHTHMPAMQGKYLMLLLYFELSFDAAGRKKNIKLD